MGLVESVKYGTDQLGVALEKLIMDSFVEKIDAFEIKRNNSFIVR